MSNRPIKTYAGGKANYVVGGDEINEVIEHLNDLFVGKTMTTEEMRLLQHIVFISADVMSGIYDGIRLWNLCQV